MCGKWWVVIGVWTRGFLISGRLISVGVGEWDSRLGGW